MLIMPPKAHISLLVLFNAGPDPIIVFEAPGIHGAKVIGVQGFGMNKPAATAGLAGLQHKPKGSMFTKGLPSIILAAGLPFTNKRFKGKTIKLLGAAPKMHCIMAPAVTSCVMKKEYKLNINKM